MTPAQYIRSIRYKIYILFAASLWLFLQTWTTAHAAEFKSGNMLLQEINDTSDTLIQRSVALGYIQGISDAGDGVNHCMPTQVTAGQLRDVVKNYLTNNPAIRHLLASVIVGGVLKTIWPCTNNKGTGV